MEDRKKNLRTWLMAVAVVLAAVLAAVIPILITKEPNPEIPTVEDVAILNKLRPLIEENQFINNEYRSFAESNPNTQRADNVIATCNGLLQRKKALLDSLKLIKPSSYYSKVYWLLVESITSDKKLLFLQKSYIEKLKVNSKVMAEVRQQRILLEYEMLKMTKTEKKIKALPKLKEFRDTLTYYKMWFDRNEAERRTSRSNSIEAIRLLDAEIREKGLHYVHPNVYEEVDPFDNDDL
jgi:hypothetical protein